MRSLKQLITGSSIFVLLLVFACRTNLQSAAQTQQISDAAPRVSPTPKTFRTDSAEIKNLLASAEEQTTLTKSYDPSYVVISYPNGDVPIEKGVCTDVVIRAFRQAGVDLQKEIHEDMSKNFGIYPKKWGLKSTDTNIDHRRVPNLQTFFTRKGKSLAISDRAEDYKPGDIVTWELNEKGLAHIGIVSDIWNEKTKRYSIIHNIGAGTAAEDVLFNWKITGHYRYF